MCQKSMSSGPGASSRKKIPRAGAAPKQAGSETLSAGKGNVFKKHFFYLKSKYFHLI